MRNPTAARRETYPLVLSNNVAGKLHTLRRQNLIVPSFALSCLPLFLLFSASLREYGFEDAVLFRAGLRGSIAGPVTHTK
jgi:hypothetical protein